MYLLFLQNIVLQLTQRHKDAILPEEDTMSLYRFKKLDNRFKLHKAFGHTVCIDLYVSWVYESWLTEAERFLQDRFGDQAELSNKTYGKWSGEYEAFSPSYLGYRISLENEKYLSLLMMKMGYPTTRDQFGFANSIKGF